ncbi:hypothetical protein ISN45_Aa03g017890, partial [Arabidopsis thaliana x Arabidopsis arenosa]
NVSPNQSFLTYHYRSSVYTFNNFLKNTIYTSMERTFNNKQIPVKMTSPCK